VEIDPPTTALVLIESHNDVATRVAFLTVVVSRTSGRISVGSHAVA
jgi:hypothetical protein